MPRLREVRKSPVDTAVMGVGMQCWGPYTRLDTFPPFYTGKAKEVAPGIWGMSAGTQAGLPEASPASPKQIRTSPVLVLPSPEPTASADEAESSIDLMFLVTGGFPPWTCFTCCAKEKNPLSKKKKALKRNRNPTACTQVTTSSFSHLHVCIFKHR